jgi:uncharacterized protein YcbK (DUF882 family)
MFEKQRIMKLILLIIPLLVFGCGPDYEPGEVPYVTSVKINGISFSEGPISVPVKPGEELSVFPEIKTPPSKRYDLTDSELSWRINGKPFSTENDTLVLTVADTTGLISLDVSSRWQVTESGGRKVYLTDTDSLNIRPAVAVKRKPGQSSLNGYEIGTFPDVNGDYSRWEDKLVVINSGFKLKKENGETEKIDYGSLVEPVEKNGEIVSDEDDILVKHRGQTGWIAKKAVRLPHSIKLFPSLYEEPTWYYPVTNANKNGYVLPGIIWEKFDHDEYYRQQLNPDFPHYIALDRKIIRELYLFRRKLDRLGYPARIKIICGTRNPSYNQGEREKDTTLKALYSRHQYGDALDLIVDSSHSRRMDDINGDGMINIKDADRLAEIAENLREELGFEGGIGTYNQHDVQGRIQSPYLHLDLRGLQAKWRITN